MNGEQLGGIVRAIVAAVGGYFVSKGVVDNATMVAISGAVATLAAAVWSIISNKPKAPPAA